MSEENHTSSRGAAAARRRVAARVVAATLAARLLCDCAMAGPVRLGAPERTPLGPPRDACESAQWLDVVATHTSASATDSSRYASYTYTVEGEGYGIYERRAGDDAPPLPVAEALTRIDARAVLERHEARLEGTRSRGRTALYVGLGSLVATTAGLVTFLAGNGGSSDSGVPIAVPLSLVGLGLAGSLAYLIISPSRADRAHVGFREQVLLPREDDVGSVMDAITRFNAQVRAGCGGGAVTLPAAPVAAPSAFGSGLAPPPR